MATDAQNQKIRLFVALPVPAPFRQQLAALPRKGLDGRWVHEEDYHITLRFLGDVEAAQVPAIESVLLKIRRSVFGIEAGGFGIFEGDRQTVLWAALQSTRKLTALAAAINEAFTPLGFDMPVKPYRPHITLVRLKNQRGVDAYIARATNKLRFSWQADRFNLYRSGTPDEEGRRYQMLGSFPLL